MNNMEKVISITILIAIIIATISTMVVLIDYHKQWKLIEKKLKDKE
jgi:hypothetical protein